MILLVLITAMLVFENAMQIRRARAFKRASWALYALRDRLRRDASTREELARSPLFREFDVTLSRCAGSISAVTIWSVLGVLLNEKKLLRMIQHSEVRAARIAEDSQAHYFFDLRKQMTVVAAQLLLQRHIIITGFIVAYAFIRSSGQTNINPVVEELAYESHDDDDDDRSSGALAAA